MSDVGRILEETSSQTSVTGSGTHMVAGSESYRAVTVVCDQCSLDSRRCPGGSWHTGDHFLEHSGATQSSDVLAWVYNPSIWESEVGVPTWATRLSLNKSKNCHSHTCSHCTQGSKQMDHNIKASLWYVV